MSLQGASLICRLSTVFNSNVCPVMFLVFLSRAFDVNFRQERALYKCIIIICMISTCTCHFDSGQHNIFKRSLLFATLIKLECVVIH